MEQRLLGRTRIWVSRVGLGCVTFGREIDEPESFRILDMALEHGITLLDTAESYGGGQARDRRRQSLQVDDAREVSGEYHSSEKILGRWLKSRSCRDRVVLQTKISSNFTPKHVLAALDASLQRLQTNFVDLYLFHSYDPHTPLELAMEAMTAAIDSGKVRAAGCSNFSGEQLGRALQISRSRGLTRLEVVQPMYSLVAREIESDLLPLCRAEQVGVVSYSPLAAGFLSGKYSPQRASIPKGSRFDISPSHADRYFTPSNFRSLERLRRVAGARRVAMAQMALAWVLRNPEITSVLIGATSPAHVKNAIASLDLERFRETWEQLSESG